MYCAWRAARCSSLPPQVRLRRPSPRTRPQQALRARRCPWPGAAARRRSRHCSRARPRTLPWPPLCRPWVSRAWCGRRPRTQPCHWRCGCPARSAPWNSRCGASSRSGAARMQPAASALRRGRLATRTRATKTPSCWRTLHAPWRRRAPVGPPCPGQCNSWTGPSTAQGMRARWTCGWSARPAACSPNWRTPWPLQSRARPQLRVPPGVWGTDRSPSLIRSHRPPHAGPRGWLGRARLPACADLALLATARKGMVAKPARPRICRRACR
mmetsp:Transcript_23061/g.71916  ORF Transcript_23061/g.71916 Transcript_23061/m.71916 type:complete len:269 (+) Transcript_23061:594-1400(+)